MKLLLLTALLLSEGALAQSIYPQAKKITQTETRFGVLIEDPFKWMENASDPDLWSWIEEEKEFTNNYLDPNHWDKFAARILEVRKLREEQQALTDEAVRKTDVILPSDMDEQRSVQKLKFYRWGVKSSFNKSLQARIESSLYDYKRSSVHNGDLHRILITQKADNKVVDIIVVKFFTMVTWADDKSFYYISDMDERIGGGKNGLFKHTVGEMQSEDKLLLTTKSVNSDLVVHESGDKYFAELDGTIGALQLSTGKVTNRLPVLGDVLLIRSLPELEVVIRTFQNANYGELHKLRLRDGNRSVLLPEQKFVFDKAEEVPGGLFILGLKDASHIPLYLKNEGELKLIPGINDGTVKYIGKSANKIKFSHETFSEAPKAYSYDTYSGELTLLASQTLPFEVEAEKVMYEASSGQSASMWVIKKKGLIPNSKTPTILYGYGGFRASITPLYGMYESLPWIEKGGVFVLVTLPGSLDYGISWYKLAQVGGRKHSFDSFALAAKELFKRGWTSSEHLGMLGASNGGTLVAGTLQRHSEIFKAAVPIVGVMDLLNFSLFTAGKYWTNDYGNPFTEKDFHDIYPLSPYHQLKKRHYPATMVMTAEFDDRVVPMHSFKYLARLQEYNTSDAPVLLYLKEWGGHARASGSPRESSRYVGAYYTFFAQQLGL